MPTYEVTAPTGEVYLVEEPAGAAPSRVSEASRVSEDGSEGAAPSQDEGSDKGRVRSAGSTFARELVGGLGDIVSFIGRMGEMQGSAMAGPGAPPSATAQQEIKRVAEQTPQQREERLAADDLYQAGRAIRAGAEEAYQPNPEYAEEWLASKLPGFAGSTAASMAGYAVGGPVVGSVMYGLQSGEQGAQEALAAGAPEDAQGAALFYAGAGMLSELGLGGAARLWKYVRHAKQAGVTPEGFRRVVKAAGEAAVREGIQEPTEQMLQNEYARLTFEPARPLLENVAESAVAGAVLGGTTGGAAGAIGLVAGSGERPAMSDRERIMAGSAPAEGGAAAGHTATPAGQLRFVGPDGAEIVVEQGQATPDQVREYVFRTYPGAKEVQSASLGSEVEAAREDARPPGAQAWVDALSQTVGEVAPGKTVQVVWAPEMREGDYGMEAYYDGNGQMVLNAAYLDNLERARQAIREEIGHEKLSTPEGQRALEEFYQKYRLSAEQTAALRDAGYLPREGESLKGYRLRLHDEWIAKQGRQELSWFSELVDRLVVWGKQKLGITLSQEEAARVILRRIMPDAKGSAGGVRESLGVGKAVAIYKALNKLANPSPERIYAEIYKRMPQLLSDEAAADKLFNEVSAMLGYKTTSFSGVDKAPALSDSVGEPARGVPGQRQAANDRPEPGSSAVQAESNPESGAEVVRRTSLTDYPAWKEKARVTMSRHGVSAADQDRFLHDLDAAVALGMSEIPGELLATIPKGKPARGLMGGSVIKNQDYVISWDGSGICTLRIPATEYLNAVVDELDARGMGSGMTFAEREIILTKLQMAGMQRMCMMCYVDSRRAVRQEMADRYTRFFTGLQVDNPTEGMQKQETLDMRAKTMAAGVKYGDIDQKVFIDKRAWDAAAADPKSHMNQHPELYQMLNNYTTSNASAVFGMQSYTGQYRYLKAAELEYQRIHGGLRFYSISDFLFEHALDILQTLTDVAGRKAFGHIYTKQPPTVQLLRRSGIKINMSWIPIIDKAGKIKEWQGQSFPWELAVQIKRSNPEAGICFMAINDQTLEWAMAHPDIGYIIPYHRSGMYGPQFETIARLQGWHDYTNEQRLKVVDAKKWAQFEKEFAKRYPGHEPKWKIGWFMQGKAMSDAEIVKRALADADRYGFRLPFDRFMRDKDGNPRPEAAKLLKDYARTDTPQQALKPDFDIETYRDLMRQWVKAGGSKIKVSPRLVNTMVDELMRYRKAVAANPAAEAKLWEESIKLQLEYGVDPQAAYVAHKPTDKIVERYSLSPKAGQAAAQVEGAAGVYESQVENPPRRVPLARSSAVVNIGPQSGQIVYYGSPELLKAKQVLELKTAVQAAAVKAQGDRLWRQMRDTAYRAVKGWQLPKWMGVGAWAKRAREFEKRALHIAARLNAFDGQGQLDPAQVAQAGRFVFQDFRMRAGWMSTKAFAKGQHQVGDKIVHEDPLSEINEELEIGNLVTTPDGRVGYQLWREMPAGAQAELYNHYAALYPELMWVVDMFIDPALKDTRVTINGVELPVFNRFAAAVMMADMDPNFTPLQAYTPDVLVSRGLIGAIAGALSFRAGTRSPGRKYKSGTSRESGSVRDLITGFNIRTMQALQERERREWMQAVLGAASPIPKEGVPAGWVKVQTGMDELWQAVRRLRNWKSPETLTNVTKQVEEEGPEAVEEGLAPGQWLTQRNGSWYIAEKQFPEVEARMSSKGQLEDENLEWQKFFGEAARLRGRQLMLPQRLVDVLIRKYQAQVEHSTLFRLGEWLVRNSTRLFLVAPTTYAANVGTNDLFALEAGTRYALAGALKAVARSGGGQDLRFARELFGGLVLNRFAGLRRALHLFDRTAYMRAAAEVLPDAIFERATGLEDVAVKLSASPVDYLREGEIGAAALQAIKYGNIDVRGKQRMAYAWLRSKAVTDAKAAGLRGRALRAAVDRYMTNPPAADRAQAVAIANFELLNYSDGPGWLEDFAKGKWGGADVGDYAKLVMPFPRFGYHYLAKNAKRFAAVKELVQRAPKEKRAEALADVITFAMWPAGGLGIAAGLLATAAGGDGEDDRRQLVGTSFVKYVDESGNLVTKPIDRSLVTVNRINLSAWARLLGLGGDGEEDFWLRVRNYPVIAMAGAALLAEGDARRFGAAQGAKSYLSTIGDLAGDFFSLGMAIKVPAKVAQWMSDNTDWRNPPKMAFDPYATRVPIAAYITDQTMDSFIPGSRQADIVVQWLDPIARRRSANRALEYYPGVWEAVRVGHVTGLLDRLVSGGQSGLPAEGPVDRKTGEIDEQQYPTSQRVAGLLGMNIKPVPRESYERALAPEDAE